MKKNISVFAMTTVVLSIFACAPQTPAPTQSQGIAPIPLTRVNQIIRTAEARGEKDVQILDVSQGKAHTNAAIALTLKFADSDFSTKNTSGTAPTRVSDIDEYYAYLYECTGALPTANLTPGSETDLDGSSCTHRFSAAVADNNTASQTLVFANVPPNTASNRYVVGIVARNLSDNSLNTNTAGGSGGYRDTNTGHPSNGPLSLTLTGGDVSNLGSVVVDTDNQVSSTTNLGAVIRLSDGVGATLNASTVVTPGSATSGPITLN